MKKPKIIKEGNLFHIYFKNVDFWLNRQEMLDLYAAMLPMVKKGDKA